VDTYLAVDIGGTGIRVAIFPEEGTQALAIKRISTRGAGTPLERFYALLNEMWPVNDHVRALGVAAAGPLDTRAGIIYSTPNIPGWINLPLQSMLEERHHVPVILGNDANLAAVGEWKYGAGRDHKDLVYLTISTGIGGGVILNNELMLGSRGLAAELGHIVVDPSGPTCSCGLRGHLEAMASGTAIGKRAAEQLAAGRKSILAKDPPPTAKDVSIAAYQGDALAVEVLTKAATILGKTLADFAHIFNPSIFILGGGVTQAGPIWFDAVNAALKTGVYDPGYLIDLKVVQAELKDNAGLLGALALARQLAHK
jgi:glucokinase